MVTEKLAKFVTETDLSKMPGKLIEEAKKCILDGIGVILAGSRQKAGKLAVDLVNEMGGTPQSGILGCGLKTSPALAAFANGVMAHALDFDDYSPGWQGHPTAVILPTILAMGEAKGIPGDKFLEAYAIGYETGARVNRGTGGKLLVRGWHPTPWVGSLASAAACSKILGLPWESVAMAFGIASSASGGLRVNFGTDTKPFHAGNAAKNGIIAALLAEKGFTSSVSAIEQSPLGLCQTLTGEKCDEEEIMRGLGKDFELVSTGACIKPYACCALTHTCISAILDLVEKERFSPGDIREIVAQIPPVHSEILIYSQPRTGLEGKFSLHYCLATAVLDGEAGIQQFTDEMVQRPKVQELLRKVKLFHPPDAPAGEKGLLGYPQKVTVKLKGKTILSRELSYPKGDAKNPMSFEEVERKFESCAQGILTREAIGKIIAMVKSLQKIKDVREISEAATFGPFQGK